MAEIKPLSDDNRVILAPALPLEQPFSIYIFPTNICNFRCSYCAHSLSRQDFIAKYQLVPAHMTRETFDLVVKQLQDFSGQIRAINLTGHGEPLLNPLLPEMITALKASGVSQHIEFMTNASRLAPALSERLIASGLDTIRISLQGLNAAKYREICGVDLDFEKFVGNIRYFYEHRGSAKVFIKIIDVALEAGEYQKFYDMFGPMADRIFIEECRPVYDGVESTDSIPAAADRYGRSHPPRLVCPLCFFMLGVFPNGDISPCETIYKPELLGNVRDTSLLEAWQGELRLTFLKGQLKRGRHNHEQCRRCSAPDDVSHPEDVLDDSAPQILARLGG